MINVQSMAVAGLNHESKKQRAEPPEGDQILTVGKEPVLFSIAFTSPHKKKKKKLATTWQNQSPSGQPTAKLRHPTFNRLHPGQVLSFGVGVGKKTLRKRIT